MSIDLEAIKALCAAATEGPWRYVYSKEYREHNVIVRVDDYYEDKEDTAYLFSEGCPTGKADAEFISSAREDVPALVAEVERLTQHLGTCEDCHTTHECLVDSLRAQVTDLQMKIAAAKKDLTENRVCRACKNYLDWIECKTTLCGACTNRANYFEWRGPQEGEPENA